MPTLTPEKALTFTYYEDEGTTRTVHVERMLAVIYTFAIERDNKEQYMEYVVTFLQGLVDNRIAEETMASVLLAYADSFIGSKLLNDLPDEFQEFVRVCRENDNDLPEISEFSST